MLVKGEKYFMYKVILKSDAILRPCGDPTPNPVGKREVTHPTSQGTHLGRSFHGCQVLPGRAEIALTVAAEKLFELVS